MSAAYLGVDIGATKSHALLTDAAGRVLGFGEARTGNHESVGYDGLSMVLQDILCQALQQAGLSADSIAGAGFGICGYDWESERAPHLRAIASLDIACPVELVNDAVLGLVAAADQGWGVSVVAGTSCNCWGRDDAGRYAHVIGMGQKVGEAAGGGELVERALWAIARAYTLLGSPTQLTTLFMRQAGFDTPEQFLEAYCEGHIRFDASHAPLVFDAARQGDAAALELVQWAGTELGNLAISVIRQLQLQHESFDVVQAGNFYRGSPLLSQAMAQRIHQEAPDARLVRLEAPPVVGAVLLAMDTAGCDDASMHNARQALIDHENVMAATEA